MSAGLRPKPLSDSGLTLVELLIAVAVLGIGVVGIVGGMMTSITVSDLDRRQADGQTALRAWAEAVSADSYTACATTYAGSGYTAPSGWTGTLTVTYWNASTSTFSSACGTDSGLQRVRLSLTTTDGRGSETLQLAKRQP